MYSEKNHINLIFIERDNGKTQKLHFFGLAQNTPVSPEHVPRITKHDNNQEILAE